MLYIQRVDIQASSWVADFFCMISAVWQEQRKWRTKNWRACDHYLSIYAVCVHTHRSSSVIHLCDLFICLFLFGNGTVFPEFVICISAGSLRPLKNNKPLSHGALLSINCWRSQCLHSRSDAIITSVIVQTQWFYWAFFIECTRTRFIQNKNLKNIFLTFTVKFRWCFFVFQFPSF